MMRRYQSDSALYQMKYSANGRLSSAWIFCRLNDLLLVEITSCIDDFFVGDTTCSAVGQVVVLLPFAFHLRYRRPTNALGFFGTV